MINRNKMFDTNKFAIILRFIFSLKNNKKLDHTNRIYRGE